MIRSINYTLLLDTDNYIEDLWCSKFAVQVQNCVFWFCSVLHVSRIKKLRVNNQITFVGLLVCFKQEAPSVYGEHIS